MTPEERTEVIDIFISICEKFLNANKHFHLEPTLARHTIQAIKELEKENKISEEIIIGEQQEINELKKEKEWLEKTDNEQTDLILKLYEQIEKMKCCGNCKHYKQANNYLVGTCKEKYDVEGNNICDKWEWAE